MLTARNLKVVKLDYANKEERFVQRDKKIPLKRMLASSREANQAGTCNFKDDAATSVLLGEAAPFPS